MGTPNLGNSPHTLPNEACMDPSPLLSTPLSPGKETYSKRGGAAQVANEMAPLLLFFEAGGGRGLTSVLFGGG